MAHLARSLVVPSVAAWLAARCHASAASPCLRGRAAGCEAEEGTSMLMTSVSTQGDPEGSFDGIPEGNPADCIKEHMRCWEWVKRAPSELQDSLKTVCTGWVVRLKQRDFDKGTYMITRPGIYVLDEDITFAPKTSRMFPPKDSAKYTRSKGFFLGFFAAISIAADNVMLDLAGHTLSASPEFVMRQRFYKHILLANLPFPPRAGPPQFAVLEGPLVPARNVAIIDGTLGLSSHMGIHGNNNQNIWASHLRIRDFEVGGFQLNNASNVHLCHMHIGPAMGAPGSSQDVPALATLSQSVNLLRHVQDAPWENKEEFRVLDEAVERFIRQRLAGEDPDDDDVFANRVWGYTGKAEGSAMYGVSFTPAGPAVGDFASIEECEDEENQHMRRIAMTNVTITGLHMDADEVVGIKDSDWRPLMGPAGDIFQVMRCKDKHHRYAGNELCDAQAKLGRIANKNRHLLETNPDQYFAYFGGTNMPEDAQAWIKGHISFQEMVDRLGGTFACGLDSMSHSNKGIVAVRHECIKGLSMKDVRISDLRQEGGRSKDMHYCYDYEDFTAGQYNGDKTHGLLIVAPSWKDDKLPEGLVIEDIKAKYGTACGMNLVVGETALTGDEGDAFADISKVYGVNEEMSVLTQQTVR